MTQEKEIGSKYVGIDIGTELLVVAIGSSGKPTEVPNTPASVERLIDQLKGLQPSLIVMEPTGGYEIPLAASLAAAGLPVAVVNACQIRNFAKAKGVQLKDDKIDAKVIAHFAEAIKPEVRPLKDEETMEIDSLVRRRKQLQEVQIAERCRLKTAFHKRERESLEAHIAWLTKELKEVEKTLQQRIQASPIWRDKDKLIQSVPGVGKILAMTLLAGLPELGRLNRGQIAALVGIAPYNCDSGKMRLKRHIKGGRPDIRCALFCTTRAAVQRGYNPLLVEYAQRLTASGKPYKVVMVACMRKLLVILNTMVANNTPWTNSR